MKTTFGFIIVAVVVICSGCASIGEDLGKGLISGVNQQADTLGGKLGGGLVTGARDSLTNAETRQKLAELLTMLGDTLNAQVRSLRDSLLGSYLQLWLQAVRNDLLGPATRRQIAALRDELIGANTREHVKQLRNEILGDSTKAFIGAIRDELLGARTRSAVDSLVEQAIASVEKGYRDKIRPLAREEEGWLRQNITTVLVIVGAIIAALMALGYYVNLLKQRNRKAVAVVTREIENIDDKKLQESLKKRIQEKATREGIEAHLHAIIKEEGLSHGR